MWTMIKDGNALLLASSQIEGCNVLGLYRFNSLLFGLKGGQVIKIVSYIRLFRNQSGEQCPKALRSDTCVLFGCMYHVKMNHHLALMFI